MNNQIAENLFPEATLSPEQLIQVKEVILWYYEKINIDEVKNIKLVNGMISFIHNWILNTCPSLAIDDAVAEVKRVRVYEEQQASIELKTLSEIETLLQQ